MAHNLSVWLQIVCLSIIAIGVSCSKSSLQGALSALRLRQELMAADDDGYQTEYNPDEFYQNEMEQKLNEQQLNRFLAESLLRNRWQPDYAKPHELAEIDGLQNYYLDPHKQSSMFRERDEGKDELRQETEWLRHKEREQQYKQVLNELWAKMHNDDNVDDESMSKGRPGEVMWPHELNDQRNVWNKRRSFPVLPWLPASRKKRFPVSKRSPPIGTGADAIDSNAKMAKDLRAIFGEATNEAHFKPITSSSSTVTPHVHSQIGGDQFKLKVVKKSEYGGSFAQPDAHKNKEQLQTGELFQPADGSKSGKVGESSDALAENKLIKRKLSLEELREDQIIPGDLNDLNKKKKAIDWSKYFGLDRKKKSEDWIMNRHEYNFNEQHLKSTDLENINRKLGAIENKILNEAVQLTGKSDEVVDPDANTHLTNQILSRLATAFNLEKMRRALEKLRTIEEVDMTPEQKSALQAALEPAEPVEKEKRVAIKKEKVDFDNANHSIESATEKVVHDVPNNSFDESHDDKKKKRGSNDLRIISTGPNDIREIDENFDEGIFGPPNDFKQCEVFDIIEKRCFNVNLLGGDVHQDLLSICGVHQLCYLCGKTEASCDLDYLNEADSVCGLNMDCQYAARSALMVLRGVSGLPLLAPHDCVRNPCIERMQGFGY